MTPKRSRKTSLFHGIAIVDKPQGMTSQDVVDVVRRAADTRRVGHTGTLDPLATGLLIVLVGEATKLSEYLVGHPKEYEGTFRLGFQSNTYDLDGEVVAGPAGPLPDIEVLRRLATGALGPQLQAPPPYSARKVDGRKLYEYARAGETVEVEPRAVEVRSFDILGVEGDSVRFRVAVSAGTYVRTLVHELGQKAGCGAVLSSLRRTAIADFKIDEAVALDVIREGGTERFDEWILPMVDACTTWPIYYLDDNCLVWIRRGQALPSSSLRVEAGARMASLGELVFLCPLEGDAIAVAKTVVAPPSRPPAEFSRATPPWFQPVKLLTSGEGG